MSRFTSNLFRNDGRGWAYNTYIELRSNYKSLSSIIFGEFWDRFSQSSQEQLEIQLNQVKAFLSEFIKGYRGKRT